MSPEIRACVSPAKTYAGLARRPSSITFVGALRRPLVAAVVLGAAMPLASTRHLTPQLLLDSTILWSVVAFAQVAIALLLVSGPSRATVGPARALDLFFISHAPWSLWLLAAAAWAPTALGRPFRPVMAAAVVPMVLTPRIIAAFFRDVLEMDPRRARLRTAVHQAMTWGLLAAAFGAAVAIWPRVLERLR